MRTKKQLYKDAEDYAMGLGVPIDKHFRTDVELAYVDGATSAQQELQAYRDIIKELLPMAEKTFDSIARHEVIYAPNKLYKEEVAEIIDKARKLIDTVTPNL